MAILVLLVVGSCGDLTLEFPVYIETDEEVVNIDNDDIFNFETTIFAEDFVGIDEMSVSPPDGWFVETGTWGTDADIVTTPVLSGGHSLNLKDTLVATKVISGWIPVAQRNEIPSGNLYYIPRVRVRADSIAAGNTVTITFKQYQADRTTLVSTSTLKSGVLAATNTWEDYGGALTSAAATTASWGRFELSKAANAFNVYIDLIHLIESPPYFTAYASPTTTLTDATWSSVKWITAGVFRNLTLTDLNADLTTIEIYEPGLYIINANIMVAGAADQQAVSARFRNIVLGQVPANVTSNASGTAIHGFTLTAIYNILATSTLGLTNTDLQIYTTPTAGMTVSSDTMIYIAKLR